MTKKSVDQVKLVNSKQQLLLNQFYAKRTENDLDLVSAMAKLISEEIGSKYGKIFLADSDIMSVKDRLPAVQRVIINKYFNILLLKYKALSGNNVLQVLNTIVDDGTHDDWFKIMSGFTIGYCKEKTVFQIVYPDKKD